MRNECAFETGEERGKLALDVPDQVRDSSRSVRESRSTIGRHLRGEVSARRTAFLIASPHDQYR